MDHTEIVKRAKLLDKKKKKRTRKKNIGDFKDCLIQLHGENTCFFLNSCSVYGSQTNCVQMPTLKACTFSRSFFLKKKKKL